MVGPSKHKGLEAPPASARSTPGLGPIFLIVFLDILGFSLVLPFLAEESRTTFGTSELTGTLLASIYSLMQFLFVPVWGRISDRVGRRPVLLWSVAATSLGMAGLGFGLLHAQSILWLFVARAASGIATANLGTASAYIADVTKPEERSKGMGLIGMAFGLGFILGPGIGGALSGISIGGRTGAVPCFVAASLSVVNLAWTYVGLRESLPPEKRARTRRSLSPLNLAAAREAFARPGIAIAILVNFSITLSFTVLDQTFRFFNKDLFAMTPLDTGIVLAFIGIVAAGVQGGLIRPLSKRFSESSLIRTGPAIQALRASDAVRGGRLARARQRHDAAERGRVRIEARRSTSPGRDARNEPIGSEPRAHVRPEPRRMALRIVRSTVALPHRSDRHGDRDARRVRARPAHARHDRPGGSTRLV